MTSARGRTESGRARSAPRVEPATRAPGKGRGRELGTGKGSEREANARGGSRAGRRSAQYQWLRSTQGGPRTTSGGRVRSCTRHNALGSPQRPPRRSWRPSRPLAHRRRGGKTDGGSRIAGRIARAAARQPTRLGASARAQPPLLLAWDFSHCGEAAEAAAGARHCSEVQPWRDLRGSFQDAGSRISAYDAAGHAQPPETLLPFVRADRIPEPRRRRARTRSGLVRAFSRFGPPHSCRGEARREGCVRPQLAPLRGAVVARRTRRRLAFCPASESVRHAALCSGEPGPVVQSRSRS